jgi:hypothetical protein
VKLWMRGVWVLLGRFGGVLKGTLESSKKPM